MITFTEWLESRLQHTTGAMKQAEKEKIRKKKHLGHVHAGPVEEDPEDPGSQAGKRRARLQRKGIRAKKD